MQTALLLLLTLAQPVVPVARPPRPPMPLDDEQPGRVSRLVEVELFGEHQLLWHGTLRVAPGPGAGYSETIRQAPAEKCPPLPSRTSSSESSLRLTLNVFDAAAASDTWPIVYSVEWDRPGKCTGGPVQRSVKIDGTVAAVKDRTDVVTGDGGLELHVTAH